MNDVNYDRRREERYAYFVIAYVFGPQQAAEILFFEPRPSTDDLAGRRTIDSLNTVEG
ncbi:hypothetical protein [Cupriavidus sp. PET2-C1]